MLNQLKHFNYTASFAVKKQAVNAQRLHFLLFYMIMLTISPFILMAQPKHDTTYYKKYDNRLILTFYSSKRNAEVAFTQKFVNDTSINTSINFMSNAPESFGIGLDYDKLSLSFDYRTVQPSDATVFKTGYNKVSSLVFNFGGNHYIVENSWRRFKGFYDNNTAVNFAGYDTTQPYFQNRSMELNTFRTKIIAFSNHKKFSYKSAYGNMYRQMKSAATWLFSSNAYFQRLSCDTAFIPFYLREYYGDIADINYVDMKGVSVLGGFAFNLVLFKRFFFNMTFGLGPDIQWRKTGNFDGSISKNLYIPFSADSRFAFGFNNRNVFITLYYIYDTNELKSNFWEIKQTFFSGGLNFGYRFPLKETPNIKKMKEHKLYKLL